MGKKEKTNPKAVEARARKEEKKTTEKVAKEKAAEDALWKDDDKSLAAKQKRKEEADKKAKEQAEKKALLKTLYDQESGEGSSAPAPKKLTRAEIEYQQEKERLAKEANEKKRVKPEVEPELLPNMNRVLTEASARNVDEAIAVLSINDSEGDAPDKHPEKRMRAAFAAYEDKYLPVIKKEYPSLRLSQWKQILYKDWNKSPENPMNIGK